VFALAVLVLIGLAAWLLRRANELCAFSLRQGRSSLVRGRAPARLIADLDEIARRSPTQNMTIRVVLESRVPRVVSTGGSAVTVQQVRNVVGQYQAVHFRTGRKSSSP